MERINLFFYYQWIYRRKKNYRRMIHRRSISVGDSVGKLITDGICVLHRRKNSVGKTVKSCSENNKYSLRKQHWNLHNITITTKSRRNFQESPIHLSSEFEPLKWSTFSNLMDISWEIDQNQAMKSLDLRTPCLAI